MLPAAPAGSPHPRPDGRPAAALGRHRARAGSPSGSSGAVQRHTRQRVVAVGSRDLDRAAASRPRTASSGPTASTSELVDDPDVDVVYIATPHNAHFPCARLALRGRQAHAGGEADGAERRPGRGTGRARRGAGGVLHGGALDACSCRSSTSSGSCWPTACSARSAPCMADHGEYFADGHRILRHDLAGGPLLDLGTYPVSFATGCSATPAARAGAGQPHPAGVNGQVVAILTDARGNQARAATPRLQQHPDHRRDRRDRRHADHPRAVLPARRR